jgi:predicted lipid-binding transport protein (Tim44 family)
MDPVLIIFIAVAGFVLYRLFSVLGARTGEERPREIEGLQRASRREAPEPAAPVQRPPAAASASAAPLQSADPDFDEAAFLDGAKAAYEMIVEAFAAGDLKSIRRYMSGSVYEAFRGALAAREAEKRTFELKFVGIDRASIRSASVEGDEMTAEVDFTSNQVRVTRDEQGAVVDGDPNRIDLVRDVWTFSRPLRSNDPNWTLVATGGA